MARPSREVRTEDMEVHQPAERVLRSDGDASEALDPPQIEVSNRPLDEYMKKKADILAFMEEEVEVEVEETADPTATPIPEVCNGGDRNRQYFIRGVRQKVKRKYIEVLARARQIKYTQEVYVDEHGLKAYRHIPRSVPAYQFRVYGDSAKGEEWLRKLLKEA